MPRTCTCCGHANRLEIDASLVAGESFRNIAERYGTSTTALFRHKHHVGDTLAKAKEAADVAHGDDLLAKIRVLEADAQRIAKAAERADDHRTALVGVRELLRMVELMAKLRGDLKDNGVTVNVSTAVGVQVATMSLEEQELRLRNATVALARLKDKAATSTEEPPVGVTS